MLTTNQSKEIMFLAAGGNAGIYLIDFLFILFWSQREDSFFYKTKD